MPNTRHQVVRLHQQRRRSSRLRSRISRASESSLLRLRLFGHTRMPDTVPAKAILTLACEVYEGSQKVTGWKRPRGRPPTTWLRQSYQRQLSHSNRSFAAGDRPFKMEIARYGHLGYASLMMMMMMNGSRFRLCLSVCLSIYLSVCLSVCLLTG